jgi:hypothetical protein
MTTVASESQPPTISYQTPAAYESAGVWTENNLVLASDCAIFPPRCIRCNGNHKLQMKTRTLAYTPSAVYFFLLLGLIPGVLLAMLFQRKVTVRLATCSRCRRYVAFQQLLTLGFVLCAFGGFFAGATVHKYLSLAGIALLLFAIIYGICATRLFSVKKIKKNTATLAGLGRPFIVSLNEHPAPVSAP